MPGGRGKGVGAPHSPWTEGPVEALWGEAVLEEAWGRCLSLVGIVCVHAASLYVLAGWGSEQPCYLGGGEVLVWSRSRSPPLFFPFRDVKMCLSNRVDTDQFRGHTRVEGCSQGAGVRKSWLPTYARSRHVTMKVHNEPRLIA